MHSISDTGDLRRRIGHHFDQEAAPVVTCNRCASDYYVVALAPRAKRFRCHCGRVFFEVSFFENDHAKTLCVTPGDHESFLMGKP